MEAFYTLKSFQNKIDSLGKDNSIAFVPTMGALHKGHLSLIKKAKKENDVVVVSIFVNPTQFDNKDDLKNYPITLENDLKLLKKVNCDLVLIPKVKEIYPTKITSEHFEFGGIENEMEGKFRKGHFNGVGTIVKRLFEIVKPHKAYFGEKDFQQLQIIKKLVEIEKLPIKVIGCKIFREKDGLAMSSRNARLTTKCRDAAPFIYKILKKVKKKFKKKDFMDSEEISAIEKWVEKKLKKQSDLTLEYFTIANESTLKNSSDNQHNPRAFIAAFAGEIRLIDNIAL